MPLEEPPLLPELACASARFLAANSAAAAASSAASFASLSNLARYSASYASRSDFPPLLPALACPDSFGKVASGFGCGGGGGGGACRVC